MLGIEALNRLLSGEIAAVVNQDKGVAVQRQPDGSFIINCRGVEPKLQCVFEEGWQVVPVLILDKATDEQTAAALERHPQDPEKPPTQVFTVKGIESQLKMHGDT
jgi:hypothetical protein